MRMMLRLHIDATRGTAALKSGALQKAIGAFSQKFKPEATYFGLESGQGTGFFIFDMKNSNQCPEIAEAFWLRHSPLALHDPRRSDGGTGRGRARVKARPAPGAPLAPASRLAAALRSEEAIALANGGALAQAAQDTLPRGGGLRRTA
jgi:hypothetical protein